MNNNTHDPFFPMDVIHLGFYYNLLSYSIGILLYVFTENYWFSGCLLSSLICFLPLTLLATDNENFTTNFILTSVFPCIMGLYGIFIGKMIHYFTILKHLPEHENEKSKKKGNDCKRIGKCCTIFVIVTTIMILYLLDITIPFAVYYNPYLIFHFFTETILFVIIISFLLGFKETDKAFLYSMTSLTILSILSTTFYIFKIIDGNYFWNFLFIIHSVFSIIVILTIGYLISLINYFIYYRSQKDKENQDIELNTIDITNPLSEEKIDSF